MTDWKNKKSVLAEEDFIRDSLPIVVENFKE